MKISKIFLFPFLMSLFFICFNTNEAVAQNHRAKKKERKVVRKVYKNRGNNKVVTRKKRSLPTRSSRAKVINHKGVNYRYDNGLFYKNSNRNYLSVRPPIGIRVTSLPTARILFNLRGLPYYYYDGIYYNSIRNGYYEVIAPPIGAQLDRLPPFSNKVYVDGREYYVSENIYYKTVQNRSGRLVYEVIGYD